MFAVILIIVLFSSVSIVGFSLYTGISPMPSSSHVKRALLEQGIAPQKIYELGSGWGGVASSFARHFSTSKVAAYEISPLPFLFSLTMQFVKKRKNLAICRKNFFNETLESADLVYCYLCPYLMQQLQPKFEKELKAGCIVLSNSFAVPGWEPDRIIEVDDLWNSKIYIYKR